MGIEDLLSLSPVWLWLGVAVIMGIIEAFTMGLTTIWFVGGALVAALVSCITDSFLVQLFVFTVVSLVLVYFTRPIAKKMLNTKVERTNVDAVIGARGRAESDIRHDLRGTVRADNKMWTAVLADDSPDISTGDTVIVERIEGVKLIVKKEIK